MSTLGPYEAGERIAQLALGEVVEARRTGRTDLFALVLVEEALAANHRLAGLLRLEVSRAAGVRHPSLVRLIEVAQPDQRLIVVADRPPGMSLARVLTERQALPIDETLTLVRALAEALDAAHARRVFSGDISPESIFVGTDGAPRLLGLGLVTAVATDDRRQVATLRRWLPGVAPEAIGGGEPTAATDGYALGACAWLLVTGESPGAEAAPDTLGRAALDVLGRQLAPEASRRYPSCVAFVTALADALPRRVDAAPAVALPATPTPSAPPSAPAPPTPSAQPRPAPRLRWQDDPDPPALLDPPAPAQPRTTEAPAPRPGGTRAEPVEPTPELLIPVKRAYRWSVAGALFAILLPTAFFGGLAWSYGGGAIGLMDGVIWLAMLAFWGGPAVVRALNAWDVARAPRFERIAGRIYLSKHSYARKQPSAYVYLPNGVTFAPDWQATRALEKAGAEASPDEVRVVADRLEKLCVVDGEIVYSAAMPLVLEVRRADGTEIYTEPSYGLARRIAQKRTVT